MNKEFGNTFLSYISRISNWNAICENKAATADEKYHAQIAVTREECKELLKAIQEDDHQELLDGVADVIVTAGYLAVLNKVTYARVSPNKGEGFSDVEEAAKVILSHITNLLSDEISLELVNDFYEAAFKQLGPVVDEYMLAVLNSNDTKILTFPIKASNFEIETILEEEKAFATEKYAPDWTNIEAIRSDLASADKVFYVLRADSGFGKILKPSGFKHPSHFLN